MDIEEKLSLIQQVGEEIVTADELRELLGKGENLVAYDGFEPSGQIHIAAGILRAINVNKMIKAGFSFKMLVADWHAYLNNKLHGDLEKIQTTGKYFIEVWKAAGMDLDHVEFMWASDLVKDVAYWELVMKIAKTNSVRRFAHSAEIMGRTEEDNLTLAQLMYVAMQVADIFYLQARVTQLGMDQRKVNMLAREVAQQLGYEKPVVVSHHMLLGLQHQPSGADNAVSRAIEMKMSKSNPDSAIFMTDSPEEVERKINKAYCPEGVVQDNPILEYCKYIVFEVVEELLIERSEKFGGNVILSGAKDLEEKFAAKEIHPQDVKRAVAREINKLLEPVRRHFETDNKAKELLEKVKSYTITR